MEFSANAYQEVAPQSNVVFDRFPNIWEQGLVVWNENLNQIVLRGVSQPFMGCCAWRNYDRFVRYMAFFSANIDIPAEGTVEPISLILTINGAEIPGSEMIITPAAVEEFGNVSKQVYVPVLRGCCPSIAVKNDSTQDVGVQNATLTIVDPYAYV